MLQTRLGLIGRIRAVELDLAREEHARAATLLLRGRSHDLGNLVQIVRLAAIEIERRAPSELLELVRDLRNAAEQATAVLGDLLAAARPEERAQAGAAVAPAVRDAARLAQPAIAASVDLKVELSDTARTRATAAELEAIVIAAVIDADAAGKLTLVLRERQIQGAAWIELLRIDDRNRVDEIDAARAFEPFSMLQFVKGVVDRVGGEVSLAPGRGGLELAIALPLVA